MQYAVRQLRKPRTLNSGLQIRLLLKAGASQRHVLE